MPYLVDEPKETNEIPLLGGVARSDGVVNILPGGIWVREIKDKTKDKTTPPCGHPVRCKQRTAWRGIF